MKQDLPSSKMKRRANAIILPIIFVFVITIVCQLFNIMVIKSEEFQKMADSSQFGAMPIKASRGSIYSSDGKILAQSATVFKICIDPDMYQKYDLIAIKEDEQDQKKIAEAKAKNEAKKNLIVEYLSSKLDIEKEDIIEAMGREKCQYVMLAKDVEMDVKNDVLEYLDKNGVLCIFAEKDTKRYYPQDSLASSVVGFIDYDGNGQYGIERQYDEYLAGVDGVTISAKDAQGNQMPYRYSKLYDAEDGNSVVLTIDTMVQYYLESALNSAVEKNMAAENGCAIVMNAKTGAILGMATAPGFDINNKGELPESALEEIAEQPEDKKGQKESELLEKMWKNKAISTTYEPGSVFKVFTSSAAFEEKLLSYDDQFECVGWKEVLGEEVRCWCYGDGGHIIGGQLMNPQNFKQALSNSCNPAFMTIGMNIGAQKFSYYMDAFGFRERTGIDLPSEVNSYFSTEEDLENDLTLARSAFGQINTVTPIQVITGYAAAVNGGYLLKPYVVQKVLDSDNNTVKQTSVTVKRQVISEDTSAKMREALQYVVDNNASGNVYIDGYRIGGKSGTSEKIAKLTEDKRNAEKQRAENPGMIVPEPTTQYVASYCCFAPADDPEIILLVMIDEPNKEIAYYGSKVAVPCAAEIMKNILPYLGYYPEYKENEEQYINVKIPDIEDMDIEQAEKILKEKGFVPEVRGDGDKVVAQIPGFTSSMPSGGTVIIYTTEDYSPMEVIMPDLSGKSLKDVNQEIASLKLNIKSSGSLDENATVISQSIAAGSAITEGTIVSVQFANNSQAG